MSKVTNYLVIREVPVWPQKELPLQERHHHFESTQVFGTAPPVLSGCKCKTCSILKSAGSGTGLWMSESETRVWGCLAYHLLFYLHIGTDSPLEILWKKWPAAPRGQLPTAGRAKGRTAAMFFFFLKITPGAAVVAQRCDPWFMGSSLRSLQELWLYPISTGEPTQPWPGLRSSRGKEWICPAARRIATTKGFE